MMYSISLPAQNDSSKPTSVNEKMFYDSLKFIWVENKTADIFPEPVDVKYFDEYMELVNEKGNAETVILVSTELERKAANVFNRQLSKYDYPEIPIIKSISFLSKNPGLIIRLNVNVDELQKYGNQAYSIKWNSDKRNVVEVSGSSLKGLIYGAASLSQLVVKRNDKIVLRKADVIDYSKFSRRIFNSQPLSNNVEDDLDWMVRYKIECIAFHNADYSWDKIDNELQKNLQNFSDWGKKYGGVEALLMLNLYRGKQIEISNKNDVETLKNVIYAAYEKGVSRVMILADDSPPFRYGEGYVSDSESDRKKFSTMAESHCALMNEINEWNEKKNLNLELLYCPAFYTYQEMHYGEMSLYQNTPWEDDAYGPFKRDLKIISEKMPKEIFLFWTGPDVCSRTITDEDLNDWTNNLLGRRPFLFDNSIFAQFEFTSRTMFTAYDNSLPKDFDLKTGGNGIFINGDGTGETSRAANMTANAYMWEGDKYNPQVSLMNAMIKLYGIKSMNVLLKYKEAELDLVKTIKQKELQDVSDILLKSLEKIKSIIGISPFEYQQNYSRMKALGMQLKNSVPEPEPLEKFKNKCLGLDKKRWELLKEIEKLSFERLSYSLQKEMVKLPDFNNGK